MIHYIYALYESNSKTKFYVGRTEDPKRRLSEHRSGAKNYKDGDEDKYLYASQLNALGIEWDMEILANCDETTKHYEDFYVNKYRHEPLQNMRSGDSEPWMGTDYRTPQEFLQARLTCVNKAKFKAARVKIKHDTDPDKTLWSFEKPEKRFMSPAFEELAKKLKKR